MKLYYFNPCDYGSEYFVMASSKMNAIMHLLLYFRQQIKNGDFPTHAQYDYDQWNKVPLSDNDEEIDNNLPDKFRIDVYETGEVIESEIT